MSRAVVIASAGHAIGDGFREQRKKKDERKRLVARLANTDEWAERSDELEAFSLQDLQGIEDNRIERRADELRDLKKKQLLASIAQSEAATQGTNAQTRRLQEMTPYEIEQMQAAIAGRNANTAFTGVQTAATAQGIDQSKQKWDAILQAMANPQEVAQGMNLHTDINGNMRAVDTRPGKGGGSPMEWTDSGGNNFAFGPNGQLVAANGEPTGSSRNNDPIDFMNRPTAAKPDAIAELVATMAEHRQKIAAGDNRHGFANLFSRQKDLDKALATAGGLPPEQQALIQTMLAERGFGGGKPPVKQNGGDASAQKEEALRWAAEHPDDPRAKKIREYYGF
jgi:hypothetical protein